MNMKLELGLLQMKLLYMKVIEAMVLFISSLLPGGVKWVY